MFNFSELFKIAAENSHNRRRGNARERSDIARSDALKFSVAKRAQESANKRADDERADRSNQFAQTLNFKQSEAQRQADEKRQERNYELSDSATRHTRDLQKLAQQGTQARELAGINNQSRENIADGRYDNNLEVAEAKKNGWIESKREQHANNITLLTMKNQHGMEKTIEVNNSRERMNTENAGVKREGYESTERIAGAKAKAREAELAAKEAWDREKDAAHRQDKAGYEKAKNDRMIWSSRQKMAVELEKLQSDPSADPVRLKALEAKLAELPEISFPTAGPSRPMAEAITAKPEFKADPRGNEIKPDESASEGTLVKDPVTGEYKVAPRGTVNAFEEKPEAEPELPKVNLENNPFVGKKTASLKGLKGEARQQAVDAYQAELSAAKGKFASASDVRSKALKSGLSEAQAEEAVARWTEKVDAVANRGVPENSFKADTFGEATANNETIVEPAGPQKGMQAVPPEAGMPRLKSMNQALNPFAKFDPQPAKYEENDGMWNRFSTNLAAAKPWESDLLPGNEGGIGLNADTAGNMGTGAVMAATNLAGAAAAPYVAPYLAKAGQWATSKLPGFITKPAGWGLQKAGQMAGAVEDDLAGGAEQLAKFAVDKAGLAGKGPSLGSFAGVSGKMASGVADEGLDALKAQMDAMRPDPLAGKGPGFHKAFEDNPPFPIPEADVDPMLRMQPLPEQPPRAPLLAAGNVGQMPDATPLPGPGTPYNAAPGGPSTLPVEDEFMKAMGLNRGMTTPPGFDAELNEGIPSIPGMKAVGPDEFGFDAPMKGTYYNESQFNPSPEELAFKMYDPAFQPGMKLPGSAHVPSSMAWSDLGAPKPKAPFTPKSVDPDVQLGGVTDDIDINDIPTSGEDSGTPEGFWDWALQGGGMKMPGLPKTDGFVSEEAYNYYMDSIQPLMQEAKRRGMDPIKFSQTLVANPPVDMADGMRRLDVFNRQNNRSFLNDSTGSVPSLLEKTR
jgi:hypothetical protein